MFREPIKLFIAREWVDGGVTWIEFWNNNVIAKKRAENCDFCKHSLYQQVANGERLIDLSYLMNCWKVYAQLSNLGECWLVLGKLYETFENLSYHGKFGGEVGSPHKSFWLYFSSENGALEWMNRLEYLVKSIKRVEPNFKAEHRKGCEIYESLLGEWDGWKRKTPIKYPERVPEFLESFKKYVGFVDEILK